MSTILSKLWHELNKPRKLYDLTNLIGYAIIAYMVVTLNSLAYTTGDYVGIKNTQKEAVEHHAGMWAMTKDKNNGKFMWKDEIEKEYGPRVPWFTSTEP